jgi:glutamate carboxypeptidase
MTASAEQLRTNPALTSRMVEMWPLLERWVNINSFTGNTAGCDKMAEELEAAFALPGLVAHSQASQQVGTGRHVSFATRRFAAEQTSARAGIDSPARVVLVGHHDTVFPSTSSFLSYRTDGQLARGPGVLDMKGGIAVIRTALAVLADTGDLPQLSVAFVSVSDEETGSVDGASYLQSIGHGASAGLVFEAGRAADAIVVARKGTGKLRVTVHGKAAHAGNDLAAGRNAIVALARWIEGATKLHLTDGTTLNVGLIAGGTSANTVPAEACCEVDLRMVSRAAGQTLITELRAVADAVAAATGTTFNFDGGIRRQPLELTPQSETLARQYGACAASYGLGSSLNPLVGGGSDANTLSAIGVPSIDGLGPRGKGFHTADEYAEISTFQPKVCALIDFLLAHARS